MIDYYKERKMIGTRHVVRQGDTLWDISNEYLGDPAKWSLIYSHNNSPSIVKLTGSSIPEQDVIHVGQVLYIPDSSPKPVNAAIRYVYAKSKAVQYEKYKDSIFLRGVQAPITKMRIDQISEANFDRKLHKELTLRYLLARKYDNDNINALFKNIDRLPGLAGAGVIYMDRNFTLIKLRKTSRQDKLIILVREVNQYDRIISLAKDSSNKRVITAILNAGLSCTGAVLGYVAITVEGLSVPVTGGTSSILIPITTAGTLASSASCGVYTGRVINEFSGNTAYNDYLDDSAAFGSVMNALDVVSLIGVTGSFKSSSNLIKQLTSKNMSKQSLFNRWKAMPRTDRKKLLIELIKVNHQNINKTQLKAILKSMNAPKVFSQARVRKAMFSELAGAIGSAFSTSSSISDGVMNNFAIAIMADERRD